MAKAKSKNQATANTEPQPNIVFIGAKNNQNPLASINDGEVEIGFPPVEEQRTGPFYHPKASIIVRLFPRRYKAFVRKGE